MLADRVMICGKPAYAREFTEMVQLNALQISSCTIHSDMLSFLSIGESHSLIYQLI